MIKFILPTVVIFIIVLFWEKISETIYKRFNIKINYFILSILVLTIVILFFLIKD